MSDLIRFKVEKNQRFVVMELTALETKTMSFKAKGIHAWFMARPPNWKVNFEHLMKESTEGRAAIRSGLKELEYHGFLTREKVRVEGGLFSTLYTIRETPIGPGGNTHDCPEQATTDQGRLSNVDDQGRLSTGGSSTGGLQPPIIVNRKNVTSNNKHLGKSGSKDPVGVGTPDVQNPHVRQEKELEEKEHASLAKASAVPTTYQPILDAWSDVAITHQPGTKTMARIVSQIRKARTGTLFKELPEFRVECHRYTVQNIVTAIERFGLQRNNPDYLPTEKKWLKEVSLDQFFYNRFSNGNKSWFATSIRNGLQLASDHYPELTEFLVSTYAKRKGGNLDPDVAARISSKLGRYWKERQIWLQDKRVLNEKMMVGNWFDFLNSEMDDWQPHHFLVTGMESRFEKYVRS